MKKIILIIIIATMTVLCFPEIYKPMNENVVGETAYVAKIKFAEALEDGRYLFVCDLMNADTTKVLAVDRDYYDTNAPFQLETEAELDTLLKLHPNYVPILEE